MREKRNLIWLSISAILLATLVVLFTKDETLKNLSIGIIGSAFVSFVLVCSEYFTQKHATLKDVYLKLVEIQKLFVEKFRHIKIGTEYQEQVIVECLELIPSTLFSHYNLSSIKVNVHDEIKKIADLEPFRKLSSCYNDQPMKPGMLQGDEAAAAILTSRITSIVNNIDVVLRIVENNRRIEIDQIFRTPCFFADSIYQFFANIAGKFGWEKCQQCLYSKMRIKELERKLWNPILSMFAAFEQFTPGIFGPFREGYDKISLTSLQKYYFYAIDGAFKHYSYKQKPYEEEAPYLQFLGGFTRSLQELEDTVFYRKRKKKIHA